MPNFRPHRSGSPSTDPNPLSNVLVSPCRYEPLRVGCSVWWGGVC